MSADNGRFRYRLTYKKIDLARYIGHLDLQTLFRRALNRAGLPVRYSEGFNPHPIISFAQPLSVGMSGLSELVEVELNKPEDTEFISGALNGVLPAGLEVFRAELMGAGDKAAAALVKAAVYDITPAFEGDVPEGITLKQTITGIIESPQIMTLNERSGQAVDIRGLISDIQEDNGTIRAVIACGGRGNLRPSVLAGELCRFAGVRLDPYGTQYCRRELVL